MKQFAHINQVYPGTMLLADGGFTCIDEGAVLTVTRDEGGLLVPCSCGGHHLDGQLDDGSIYVGFWLADAGSPKRNSAAHITKMGRKAERRKRDYAALSNPKRVSRLRYSGNTIALGNHEHAREIARRKRQQQ